MSAPEFDPEKVERLVLPISGGIVPDHPPTGAVFARGTGTAPRWVREDNYDKLLEMYRFEQQISRLAISRHAETIEQELGGTMNEYQELEWIREELLNGQPKA